MFDCGSQAASRIFSSKRRNISSTSRLDRFSERPARWNLVINSRESDAPTASTPRLDHTASISAKSSGHFDEIFDVCSDCIGPLDEQGATHRAGDVAATNINK